MYCLGQDKTLEALGIIIMELMEKYTKDEGSAGIDNQKNWLLDSNVFGFLLVTSSAGSV
jgi:hypothetical protein